MKLPKQVLMKGIGKIIYNKDGQRVGRITDITENKSHEPNFIIVSNDDLPGFGSKYFAIPFTNVFIKSNGGHLVLKIKVETLKQADGIDFDHNIVLKEQFRESAVFQLKGYHGPINDAMVKYYA